MKDEDSRADRLESEIRHKDMEELGRKSHDGRLPKLFQCSKCFRLYEERSITCPRCDTRTMGKIESIKPR